MQADPIQATRYRGHVASIRLRTLGPQSCALVPEAATFGHRGVSHGALVSLKRAKGVPPGLKAQPSGLKRRIGSRSEQGQIRRRPEEVVKVDAGAEGHRCL